MVTVFTFLNKHVFLYFSWTFYPLSFNPFKKGLVFPELVQSSDRSDALHEPRLARTLRRGHQLQSGSTQGGESSSLPDSVDGSVSCHARPTHSRGTTSRDYGSCITTHNQCKVYILDKLYHFKMGLYQGYLNFDLGNPWTVVAQI